MPSRQRSKRVGCSPTAFCTLPAVMALAGPFTFAFERFRRDTVLLERGRGELECLLWVNFGRHAPRTSAAGLPRLADIRAINDPSANASPFRQAGRLTA